LGLESIPTSASKARLPNGTRTALNFCVKAFPEGESSIHRPDDERLRELLAVEQRLEDLVRAARDDAGRRIAAARAAGERRLTAAREAAERADAVRAGTEQADHDGALLAIRAAHEAALAGIAGVPHERLIELARWAVAQAIDARGEPA
jgi:vacuolar-type H+-ATPase subunit H